MYRFQSVATSWPRAISSASVRLVEPSASSRPIAACSRRTLLVAAHWSATRLENEIRPTSMVVKSQRSRNSRAAVWASTRGWPIMLDETSIRRNTRIRSASPTTRDLGRQAQP